MSSTVGQHPEGSLRAYDQAIPAAGSEDMGSHCSSVSLGFALGTPINPQGLWERYCPPRSLSAEGGIPQ